MPEAGRCLCSQLFLSHSPIICDYLLKSTPWVPANKHPKPGSLHTNILVSFRCLRYACSENITRGWNNRIISCTSPKLQHLDSFKGGKNTLVVNMMENYCSISNRSSPIYFQAVCPFAPSNSYL